MKKSFIFLFMVFATISLFVGCKDPEVQTYHVTVKNGEITYKVKDVADGDIYVLPSKPSEDTRPFRGWKIGESTELMQPGEDLRITGNTAITAVWDTSCTVSFDLCDDSLTKLADVSVDYSKPVSAPTSVPNRTGYAFDGWYLNEEKYEFGTTPVTEDITLKAHWTTNYYTVTFDTDGGAAMSSLKIPYGEKINIEGTPAVPEKTGYTFQKWVLEDGTTEFSFDDEITRDTKLKALWKIKSCTVSFDLGDKSLTPIDKMTVNYGTVKTAPSVPARKGYIFSAWKIKNGGIFDFANPITQDLELEAVWTEIKTNLTVYFPKNVNDVETIKVDVGGVVRTFSYSGGAEEGDYKKYTAEVTGLDHGTYAITLTTLKGDTLVGDSYSDSVNMKYDITDKEIKVDVSKIVNITTTVSAKASSVSGDADSGYVISGTATLSYGEGVTVLYSIDGSEPSTEYTSGDSIAVTNSTELKLKACPTDSSRWTKGSVDDGIVFNTIGAKGPAGGIIYYDEKTVKQDSYTDLTGATVTYKWRFFEAATADLKKCSVGSKGKSFATSVSRGKGKSNTELLKGQSSAANYAADLCANHSVTVDGVVYDDWFLPSYNELIDMLEANKVTKIMSTGVWYASSSVIGTDYVNVSLLSDNGKIEKYSTQYRDNSDLGVRPVRCF